MPFSITPDPAYLYMSPRHQEALGHLLYGTGQYGGFVQLTGEVGTGKTTVVRALLAQKLDHVDVAVILNPRQNELEFVASICDELHVKYPKRGATLKTLVDALNTHLLAVHARGRRTVLIIDEAQNLQPEVLEQVRLLTNLETDKEKLLRIMLVGQPELAALLARPDLRQLAQRITARYHLTPLEPGESAEYVGHRLRIAGGSGAVFNARALAAIHQQARGVPRLINVLCDRALLGAYASGSREVTPEIVDRAAREVSGLPEPAVHRRLTWADAAIVGLILAVAAGWLYFEIRPAPPGATPQAVAAAAPPIVEPAPVTVAAMPEPAAPPTLDALLRAAQPLPVVLSRLLEVWSANPQVRAGENVCQALAREQIGCYKSLGGWDDLRRLDRPSILTLSSGRGGVQHVLLRELGVGEALLDTAAGPLRLPLAQIDLLWTGEFLMLWRRDTLERLIGPDSSGLSIVWLRQRLAEAEGRELVPPVSPVFDAELRAALVRFQSAQGLDRDGIAGPRTLIALSNLRPLTGTPTLQATPPHVADP
ncbi:MAG: AAA family ATPase [Gammaproteobacteria bacterium]